MYGIEKRFGAVQANRGASLEVAAGEIHALVGENGAGKSTLMHILSGLLAPDAGTVRVDGTTVTGWSTSDAIRAGVGMVHQHFMLVPTLTIADNVVLGREPRRGMAMDVARAQRDVTEVATRYGFSIDARRRVGDLSVGEAQRVEILKALFRGAQILILDEPTAVLSPPEVQELWRVLRALRDGGGTIILITHKLDEVIEISDRITVMRHGQTVARMDTPTATPADIARAMVGRDVLLTVGHPSSGAGRVHGPEASVRSAAPRLTVVDLEVAGAHHERRVHGVSFTVAGGEIVGIAGVEGNGQTELVEAIAGLRAARAGRILLGGRDITTLPVRDRASLGLAHVPEDRHRRGLVLDYSVADNLILGRQHAFVSHLGLDRARIAQNARARIEQFDIRPTDPSLPARALSGGNQQKIVVAREMGGEFTVLLAAQPTRGVDVGAIEFIHAQLRASRDAGKAILLVSAELSEVLALADRVGVMYGGRLVALLSRDAATMDVLGLLMTGAAPPAAGAA
ncbi:MAG TPA: ABC transporter ATP-binding protein [Gemmatimonadaceae bacterium]|jgi:simple sugar transport system ATP-binding protein